jgi:Nucleotidyltransferase of unknown function (DUF6036)
VRAAVTKFGKSDLVAFLRALGRELGSAQSIVVIGGAAAALNYDSGTKTSDVDVMTGFSAEIAAAAVEARRATGLAVAVGPVTVADPPLNYEDRLKSARGLDFKRLVVVFPDKYDLALMKTVRGYQHDLDAIEGIHRRHRLSMKVLVDRFEAEMGQAIADPRKLRLNMAMLVARLYGLKKGQALAERWGVVPPQVG